MNFQELLRAQNLTDEQIAGITAGMKANKIYTAGEENLDIRYGKLKNDFDALNLQHGESQKLIAQMKQAAVGNEELTAKIAGYEAKFQELTKENERIRLESAAKLGLHEAKATDVDYMLFKLKEKGELSLDENGKIKGWDEAIAGLKTQFPNQFESAGKKKYEERKLGSGEGEGNAITKEQFNNMGYRERLEIFKSDPETYKELTK